MITPISHATNVQQVSQPPAAKPEPPRPAPQTPKSGELSHDQVTLKSAGNVDHDRDGS